MDEPLLEFEEELKALAPRRLESRLMDRVASELNAPMVVNSSVRPNGASVAKHFVVSRWMSFGAIGVAAAFAVVAVITLSSRNEKLSRLPAQSVATAKVIPVQSKFAETVLSDNAYQPVAAANVLYEMKDEGPAIVKGDNSERRVRYRYVDTYTWKNPRNNASLTWSVPRDEIRVQPAQFN